MQNYIQKFQRQIQAKTPESALTLAKAMKVIKKDSMNIQDILNLNYNAMLKSVDQLQKHLNSRKSKLEIMKKMLMHLNTVIDVMDEEDPSTQTNAKTQAAPTNRMAISKRL